MRVVLPAPFSPTSANEAPRVTSKSTSFRTRTAPNRLLTFRKLRTPGFTDLLLGNTTRGSIAQRPDALSALGSGLKSRFRFRRPPVASRDPREIQAASRDTPSAHPDTQRENLVELDKVTFGYDERVILRGISLHVPRGRVVAIMGGSGCGKTTTLRMI